MTLHKFSSRGIKLKGAPDKSHKASAVSFKVLIPFQTKIIKRKINIDLLYLQPKLEATVWKPAPT